MFFVTVPSAPPQNLTLEVQNSKVSYCGRAANLTGNLVHILHSSCWRPFFTPMQKHKQHTAPKQAGMQLFALRRFTESTNSRISCTNTRPAVRNTVVSVWFPAFEARGPQLARRGRTPIDQLTGSKRACQKVLMSARHPTEAWSSDVNGNQEWMISLKHSGTS